MELQGKVIAVVPPRSGVSARGEWTAQDFVIETHDTYPKKMVFSVFGADRLQRFNIQLGQEVTVLFDIDAHEYNGRWFNSIRAIDVRPFDPATAPQAAVPFVAGPAANPPYMAAPQTAAPQPPFPQDAPAPAAPQPAAPAPMPTDLPAQDDGGDLPF